jgi:hypothetical protein
VQDFSFEVLIGFNYPNMMGHEVSGLPLLASVINL